MIHKYKVWDKVKKVMLYPKYKWSLNNEYGVLEFPLKEPKNYNMPFSCGNERYELLQYTGFKDNSYDIELYEGDIVIADWFFDKPYLITDIREFYRVIIEYALDGSITKLGDKYHNPQLINGN